MLKFFILEESFKILKVMFGNNIYSNMINHTYFIKKKQKNRHYRY